jgi:ABC-type transporter Mla subunit MlaD
MSDFSDEGIKQEASNAVAEHSDIRERVRDLTLAAIKQRKMDSDEIKNIVKAMTEGIALGLEKRTQDSKQAVNQAFSGLDQALKKSAEATHLALQQITERSHDFTKQELRDALDHLKKVEQEFVDTVADVANKSQGVAKAELNDLVTHVRRAGTDTGRQVAATLDEFSRQAKEVARDTQSAASGAAHKLSSRFTQLTAGILEGMAESLHSKKK